MALYRCAFSHALRADSLGLWLKPHRALPAHSVRSQRHGNSWPSGCFGSAFAPLVQFTAHSHFCMVAELRFRDYLFGTQWDTAAATNFATHSTVEQLVLIAAQAPIGRAARLNPN